MAAASVSRPAYEVKHDPALKAQAVQRQTGAVKIAALNHEWFLNKDLFNDNLACVHCRNGVVCAMESECGHIFCELCFDQVVATSSRCPECGASTAQGSAHRSAATDNRLANQQVRCPHGCADTFKLRELRNHQLSCLRFPVECKYCAAGLVREEEDAHDAICSRKPVPCECCQQPIERGLLNEHKNTVCQEFEIPCPNGCTLEMRRGSIAEHRSTTCRNEVLSCDLCCVGCGVTAMRKDMPAHNQEFQHRHLLLLLDVIMRRAPPAEARAAYASLAAAAAATAAAASTATATAPTAGGCSDESKSSLPPNSTGAADGAKSDVATAPPKPKPEAKPVTVSKLPAKAFAPWQHPRAQPSAASDK